MSLRADLERVCCGSYGQKMIEAERRKRAADWRRRALTTLPGRRQQLNLLLSEEALRWLDDTEKLPRSTVQNPPSTSSVASSESTLQVEKPPMQQSELPDDTNTASPSPSSSSDSTHDMNLAGNEELYKIVHTDSGEASDELQPALSIAITRQGRPIFYHTHPGCVRI